MYAVSAVSVNKSFGKIKALNAVEVDIPINTIVGITGRNGAGKSTFMELAAGLTAPDAGTIRLFENSPSSLSAQANTVFIDENILFPKNFALKEIMDAGASFYRNWNEDLAWELFGYFELEPYSKISALSKGKESLFYGLYGLLTRAPLTVMDEPMNGMDETVRRDFLQIMMKDYLRSPRTILLSSHYLSEIEDLLEYLIIIEKGEIILFDEMEEIRHSVIEVSGSSEQVQSAVQGKEVLYTKPFADSQLQAAFYYRGSLADFPHLHTSWASVSDIYTYMTSAKGGIDDVYQRASDKRDSV